MFFQKHPLGEAFFFKWCDIRVTHVWHTRDILFLDQILEEGARMSGVCQAYVRRMSCAYFSAWRTAWRTAWRIVFFQKHPLGEAFFFKWCDIRVTHVWHTRDILFLDQILEEGARMSGVCQAYVRRMSCAYFFSKTPSRRGPFFQVILWATYLPTDHEKKVL